MVELIIDRSYSKNMNTDYIRFSVYDNGDLLYDEKFFFGFDVTRKRQLVTKEKPHYEDLIYALKLKYRPEIIYPQGKHDTP